VRRGVREEGVHRLGRAEGRTSSYLVGIEDCLGGGPNHPGVLKTKLAQPEVQIYDESQLEEGADGRDGGWLGELEERGGGGVSGLRGERQSKGSPMTLTSSL
jgi:hypothetical protein